MLLILSCASVYSQNETAKWYFGNYAGLDFMTNPPTTLTNNAMYCNFGSASMSDGSGNLLFYTSGTNVYTSTHTVMANGSSLLGAQNGSQPCLIVKKPASSTQYYIFTISSVSSFNNGLYYSIVDMSLASGQGSVTVKNAQLYSGYVGGKLTGTKHCNGTDFWIVIRDWAANSNLRNFQAYQLTSVGVSTTAVVSAAATWTWNSQYYYYDNYGQMKISPNGKKLVCANYNNYYYNYTSTHPAFELYDFNNSTGAVTNSLGLAFNTSTNTTYYYNRGWGCEFSPDGTKLYGSRIDYYLSNYGGIYQWDLCAGSHTAIAASETLIAVPTLTNSNYYWHADLQLAKDGKIYIANWWGNNWNTSLSVINNPNLSGSACNYSFQGQSITPKSSTYGLPNFINSYFAQPPPVAPYTFTVSNGFGCQGVAFTSPATPNTTVSSCSTIGYSLTNLLWNFGDPASGSANTSTVTNPIHAFTSLGTYTVKLTLNYSCGGGSDTLTQVVNVNQPCISVTSTSITCSNLGSATVVSTGGIGPFSFTWMPSGQTNSVATGLSPGTYTLTVFDFGNNFTYTATTVFTSLIPLTGNLAYSSSLTCNGINTGSATVTNLAGGSGNENFLWSNGPASYTTQLATGLSSGLWTVTVTDALTGCTINDLFFITQPSPTSLSLTASSPTACVGTSIVLSGINSGGIPAYTYTWTGGPTGDTKTVSPSTGGTYVYTLNSRDANNCLATETISVDFINNPVLIVSNVSICPLQTGTLTVSGASTYTWSDSSNSTTLADNPLTTTVYTVTGTALGCTTAVTPSIVLKPIPVPLSAANTPVCNGETMKFFASGGTGYYWTGPLGYTTNIQNPQIGGATVSHSGIYNLTVTAANTCTASTSLNFTVHPTPTITAAGSTVCTNQALSLTCSSFPGSIYSWTGPSGFNSNQQNPFLPNPPANLTGQFTVIAASPAGCTISANADVSVTQLPVISFTTNSPRCAGSGLSLDASGTVGAAAYLWSGPNGYFNTANSGQIQSVSLAHGGLYGVTVTTGPCMTSTSQLVVVNPLPVPIATSNDHICEGKTLSLTVNNPGYTQFVWAGPFGFINMNQNPVLNNVSSHHSGNYVVTVTDQNSCKNTSSVTVNILVNPTVTATGTMVCLNEQATITATGAEYYYWTGPFLAVNDQSAAVVSSANNILPTDYYVVGTAANTCTGIAVAQVLTRALPVPSITVSKGRVCANSPVIFQGAGGKYYYWYGPGNVTHGGQSFTYTPGSPAQTGIYTLTVKDNSGCMGSTTTSLTVDELPTGILAGDKMEGCVPYCADFRFSSTSSFSNNVVSTWAVMNKSFSGKEFEYCFSNPGEYKVVGYFNDTTRLCTNTMTFVVNARPKPEADFEYLPQKPVENSEHVIFTNQSRGEEINKWTWHIPVTESGGAPYRSEQENISYFFRYAGIYPVAMVTRNIWGCSDTIIKAVTIDPDFHVYVPDAFTPNNDDKNDVFMPVCDGVKKYTLLIFDRWGEKVFESSELNAGWDGTFKGEPCNQAVYTWKINVTSINGEIKVKTGHVTLIR